MNVRKILNTKGSAVATVKPDALVAEAARMLKTEGIGALVVSEDGRKVAGIVSERDLVRALADAAKGADLLSRPVKDLMTRDVLTCAPDDTIDACMAVMTEKRVRHLPVIDKGRLAGIISIGDVVKNRVEELEAEAGFLRELISG